MLRVRELVRAFFAFAKTGLGIDLEGQGQGH